MRVSLSTKYKSLLQGINIQLPSLTIISGLNGSGKSHLLNSINEGIAKAYDEVNNEIIPRKYVNNQNLIPNETSTVYRENFSHSVNYSISLLNSYKSTKRNNPTYTLENAIGDINQLKIIKKIIDDTGIAAEDLTEEDIYDNYPISEGLIHDVFHQAFSVIFKRYSDKLDENLYKEFLRDIKGEKKIRPLS
ncbi:MAG TPA: hypothetical protein DCM71_12700, partial [Runella sp.]|nr:hypothetical protein [Runella sp.]